jgi:peroxiredoxin
LWIAWQADYRLVAEAGDRQSLISAVGTIFHRGDLRRGRRSWRYLSFFENAILVSRNSASSDAFSVIHRRHLLVVIHRRHDFLGNS